MAQGSWLEAARGLPKVSPKTLRLLFGDATHKFLANLNRNHCLGIGVDDGTRTRSVRSHSPVLYL